MDLSFLPIVIERLEDAYGPADWIQVRDPIDELVACILSQNTSDANSFPAFDALKAYYKDWDDLIDQGPEVLVNIIRRAGLANQKSKTIIGALNFIKQTVGEYSLDHLYKMPLLEAREWLTQIPGVGPKTASIVLCFSMGLGAIPVDTHIHRVSKRLGVISAKIDANRAHDVLLQIVPKELAYRYHVALIQHGRAVCKAQRPRCKECVVNFYCDYYSFSNE